MKTKPPQISHPELLLCRTAQAAAISGVRSPEVGRNGIGGTDYRHPYRLGGCKVW